jgi:hypothetical protein
MGMFMYSGICSARGDWLDCGMDRFEVDAAAADSADAAKGKYLPDIS